MTCPVYLSLHLPLGVRRFVFLVSGNVIYAQYSRVKTTPSVKMTPGQVQLTHSLWPVGHTLNALHGAEITGGRSVGREEFLLWCPS